MSERISGKSGSPSKTPQAVLLGIGLDSDGHQRLTTGKNFALVGGSQETHEAMTETVIKLNEKLAKSGKDLAQVSRSEFEDIAGEVGLHRLQSPQN